MTRKRPKFYRVLLQVSEARGYVIHWDGSISLNYVRRGWIQLGSMIYPVKLKRNDYDGYFITVGYRHGQVWRVN